MLLAIVSESEFPPHEPAIHWFVANEADETFLHWVLLAYWHFLPVHHPDKRLVHPNRIQNLVTWGHFVVSFHHDSVDTEIPIEFWWIPTTWLRASTVRVPANRFRFQTRRIAPLGIAHRRTENAATQNGVPEIGNCESIGSRVLAFRRRDTCNGRVPSARGVRANRKIAWDGRIRTGDVRDCPVHRRVASDV